MDGAVRQGRRRAVAARRGCRTNQTGCPNLTTAVLADLVKTAQTAKAGLARPKWFTPKSRRCAKRTEGRRPRWFARQPPSEAGARRTEARALPFVCRSESGGVSSKRLYELDPIRGGRGSQRERRSAIAPSRRTSTPSPSSAQAMAARFVSRRGAAASPARCSNRNARVPIVVPATGELTYSEPRGAICERRTPGTRAGSSNRCNSPWQATVSKQPARHGRSNRSACTNGPGPRLRSSRRRSAGSSATWQGSPRRSRLS